MARRYTWFMSDRKDRDVSMILETHALAKTFGRGADAQTAVSGMELRIPRGQVYGLLGPNGAGKSTTLKMICGMLRPSKGQIVFDGHPWERADLYRIGALIEDAPLYPNLTAHENLLVRALELGIPRERIESTLERVGLHATGKKRAGSFSMGMKQRLGLALALLGDPDLLILDEPTNGLDPIGIEQLRQQIRGFAYAGTTVLVSSHILSEVQQMVDTVGIICQGHLAYQAPLREGDDLEALFMDVCRTGQASPYAKGGERA